MKRKDGQPKAARGSKTKMIDGVQHRKCEVCKEYLAPTAFHSARWECEECIEKRKNQTLQMITDSIVALNEIGITPMDLFKR